MAQPRENIIENSTNGEVDKEQPLLKVKKEPATEENLKQVLKSTKASTATTATTTTASTAPSCNARTASSDSHSRSGQTIITAFFPKKNEAGNDKDTTVDSEKKDEDEKNRIDLESIKGVFGWTTLEGVHVPYILRLEEKFTAVRIIEKSLLKKFLQALPPDVYSCTYIKSYFITDNEAKLLNEINMKHCDRQFGHEHFTIKDLVVQLTDVVQLYKFLSTCYTKLISSSTIREKDNPCGIVKIGGSPIPYVCRDAVKYVPLALFGQEVQSLETKGEKLEPWEVSYMKFCCRVANISNEFLQEHGSLVVSLDDVKQFASDSVLFEDWWPSSHENRVNKIQRNGTALSMACLTRNGDSVVVNNNQKEVSAKANIVFPCAVPATRYYDENSTSRAHKEPASGGSKLRTHQMSVSERTSTFENGTKRVQASQPHQSFANVLYPFSTNALAQSTSGLLPSTVASHNPQPYIFNGQWWGPFVSRSSEGSCISSSGISPYESWAAHCPQGPTQCSPGSNSSELQHNPISQYVQSIGQMMKSSNQPYNWPLSLSSQQSFHPSRNQLGSTFPVSPKAVTCNDSNSHKTSVVSEKTKHSNWSLDASNHSNRHWSNILPKPPSDNTRIKQHIPTNSNVTSPTSREVTHCNGSITHGNPRSAESVNRSSQRSLSIGVYERGLSLVQHLTRPDEVSGVLAASHRLVVAPGSSQSVALKISSPKPANQVPTSVALENSDRHSVASWRPLTPALGLGTTLLNHLDSRHPSISGSKLQELLCSGEAKTSSRTTTGIDLSSKNVQSQPPPLYKVHDVIVGGMRFHGINCVANAIGSDVMVPVKEVEKNLSPHVSAQLCEHIFTKILHIKLFECNRAQEEVLRKGIRHSVYEPEVHSSSPLKLIRVEDLNRNLPQVIYTLAKLQIQGQMEAVSEAKRARYELGVST